MREDEPPQDKPATTPLDYAGPRQPEKVERSPDMNLWHFVIGLLVGTLISYVGWGSVFGRFSHDHRGEGSGLAVIGIKLAAAILFIVIPGWRSIGAGILFSMAIGGLIFCGMCGSF